MTPIDFETTRRRHWLAHWHSATVERHVRLAGWTAILAFIVLGAAK